MGEVHDNCKKANIAPIFQKSKKEDPEISGLLGLASLLGKVMDQILLKAISKEVKVNKVIGNGQNASPEGKSCLTNIVALYDEGTGAVNKGRAVDVVPL